METICGRLRGDVAAIIEEWDRLARNADWLGIPREHRIDSLPDMVDRLLALVPCSVPDFEGEHREMVRVAAKHGTLRRAQRCADSVVFTEHALLRRVVSARIGGSGGDADRCMTAVLRFDIALGVATNASLLGYHRPEFEALGRWPGVLDALATDSPVLAMYRRFSEAP